MKYVVKVTETYCYEIPTEANSKKEAIEKVKEFYYDPNNTGDNDGVFCCESLEKTTFKFCSEEECRYWVGNERVFIKGKA